MDAPFDVAQEESRSLRWFSRLIVFVLLVLALGGILVSTGGCAAAMPVCQEGKAFIAYAEQIGSFYGFTPAALAQWTDAVRKEAKGECIWKKGEPT